METLLKRKPTKEELIFLGKVHARKPNPHSAQAEEVLLHFNQAKLDQLINKFGAEFGLKKEKYAA